jgi:hypothetical protein
MGPVHMLLDVSVADADYQIRTVRMYNFPYSSNVEATEWFFRMQRPVRGPGCIDTSKETSNGKPGSMLPLGRPCPPSTPGVVSDNMLSFTLPPLTPPDAMRKKTVPSDSDALLRAVRQYVESSEEICGRREAKIPFYSDTDPLVYVLLPQSGVCPRGVATFSRAPDSRWEFGRFVADFPIEQLSGVIAKVESNVAATVP